MKAETATNAKTHFGRLLDNVVREPVAIQKSGRNVAVVISYEDYQRLAALEDKYWQHLASNANDDGYLGTADSGKLLDDLLNADD